MTKAQVVKKIATKHGISAAQAERIFQDIEGIIVEELVTSGRFALTGVGVFKRVDRAATVRSNPQKPGEKVNVPAHRTVRFRPSATLYEMVNR